MSLKTPLPLKRIAVLLSGNGSNLQALIDYQAQAPKGYQIVLVISNKAQAYGLERARRAGIATCVIEHQQFPDRASFDREMQTVLDAHQVDLVVLAGFMRILSAPFTQHFYGRMLNIHPSLLPKYPGLDTHQRVLEEGDAEHGLSIHFVTQELDGGPIILQSRLSVQKQDTAASLQQKIHQLEHCAYPQVVQGICQGLLELRQDKVYFKHQPLSQPLELSALAQALSEIA
ncbi:MAG: phosphoribosylglycinamide formyltransferase [Thiotrichales bacterium]|nr:phosphoribosylglycinamide formyltransferase [Thiotrichales bacterium]